ncbi:MAG: hypothetical protein WD357_03310 [Gracilimonas sp.]
MDFQGFQFILPPAVVAIIILALLGVAWASYQKFESIPALGRWTLIGLRGLTLILILLLLLNPYFFSSEEIEVKPKIAVFLDNTESAGIVKGDYNGLNSYNDLIDRLNFSGIDDAEMEFYSIGEDVQDFSPDSLSAREIQTNLSAPVSSILEMEDNVKAGVIISDGIITYGRNPSVSAFNSSIPIHTIAIGDTADIQDIAISNVITNPTGYTNTDHIIEAELTQSGFANNTATVSLLSNNEVIQEKQITFETDDQVLNTEFELRLEEAGLKQYEITVDPLPQEWTETNNSQLFSIDVLDDRVKILHVAFQIHPDVKAIRSVIERNETNELYPLTWLGGDRYIEDLPDEGEFNLIVIHGVPNSTRDFEFLSDIENTPTIFFELSTEKNSQFDAINDIQLIRSNAGSGQASQITLHSIQDNDQHPVLELPDLDLTNLPPLFSSLRTTVLDPQSTPLFGLTYNRTDTDFPVISVLERGNIRRAHVMPWGWYRALQSTNEDHRVFTSTLLSNLVSWTSSDPDDRKLRITPVKQVFTTSEQPILNGSLRNERGDPENEGIIEVQLKDDDGSSRNFNMENRGNGNYGLNLPRLSEGLYEYTTTARKGDRELEAQTGEFLVSNTSSELASTTRNDQLMRAIAENSGGLFFTYDDIENFWEVLEAQNVLEPQVQTVENYSFPVRSLNWFVLILILLGSEWMLRKYYSLP